MRATGVSASRRALVERTAALPVAEAGVTGAFARRLVHAEKGTLVFAAIGQAVADSQH